MSNWNWRKLKGEIIEGKIFITSDEELKELKDDDNKHFYYSRKIIATTDDIGLPKLSKEFIESFILSYKDKAIDVLVEYNGTEWFNKRFGGTWQPFPDAETETRRNLVKVNKDMTINASLIKKDLKETWNRKEVRGLLIKFHNEFPDRGELNDWFKKNL